MNLEYGDIVEYKLYGETIRTIYGDSTKEFVDIGTIRKVWRNECLVYDFTNDKLYL